MKFFFVLPPHDPSSSLGSDLSGFFGCLFTVLLCFLKLFWWPLEPVVVKVFSGFRYWFRYREKKSQSSKQTKEFAMDLYPRDAKDLNGQNQNSLVTIIELYNKSQIVYDRKRSTLELVLSCYNPVLDSLLTELHYVDVVNLGLVSKIVRIALYTKSQGVLRRASCIDGTESACWSCRKQICRVRNPSQRFRSPKLTRALSGLQDTQDTPRPCHYQSPPHVRAHLLQMFLQILL